MNLSICNLDSSFFINEISVPWAVQAIDSFCREVSTNDLKDAGLVASTAIAYYARNSYDDSGLTSVYVFDKECIKPGKRETIQGTGNINTFSSWCRRSGLLYDQRGLFGLSEIASLLLKPNKITIREFAFILLAKQWVRVDGVCYRPLLSIIDLLTDDGKDFLDLLKAYTQNKDDIKDLLQQRFFEQVTGRPKATGDSISFTRFDTLRYCLFQAGILTDKNSGFKLTTEGKAILRDYRKHESRIGAYIVSRAELEFCEYMSEINNGAFSLIKEDNVAVYRSLYPNLSYLALQFDSSEIFRPASSGVYPLQQIYYGAPGTGKSYQLKEDTQNDQHIRTIFHPDSDYASFVGCYKPVTENGKIIYRFRPQAFINAYVKAWLSKKVVYLIIEEINRGNCAQIFGDIFQLLDRKNGESDYSIYPDTDLKNYLFETFHSAETTKIIKDNDLKIPEDILSGEVMRLPANLALRATMNTSDQSLFPMDSAFKRRWMWKYFSIKDEKKHYSIELSNGTRYDWWSVIYRLNQKIYGVSKSSDKQIGYWFAKPRNGEKVISAEDFVYKVIFYLWNDIFKDYSFNSNNAFSESVKFDMFFESNGSVIEDTIVKFMTQNDILPIIEQSDTDNSTDAPVSNGEGKS